MSRGPVCSPLRESALELSSLIAELARPAAFPVPVTRVETHQTHISAVFVAGDFAYKIRKPVKLSFLDFSTLAQREHDCREEVRLNRRLAAKVYLGVVPISQTPRGVVFEGKGPVVEWAVKMQRLPADATLEQAVLADQITSDQLASLGRRLARFHCTARRDAHVAEFGRFERVALNLRENLRLSADQVGQTVSERVWTRLNQDVEAALERHRPLIESRAERGIPCETHGDLHLDHVYLFPNSPPPEDLVIIDCIEFNERFRFTDPVADMAFLAMDLKFHGRRDLVPPFCQAYFEESGDEDGRQLLSLYSSYRAAVRGKVEGMVVNAPEVPAAERTAAAQRARGHWLLALSELLPPRERPGLLLVGGLPGTGKSTLARELAQRHGFTVIRSDVVRKELAGVPAGQSASTFPGEGLYSKDWNRRTYTECRKRAEAILGEGGRVVVDATFSAEQNRREFLALADELALPAWLLICEAEAETVRRRITARTGDASDADWNVYLAAREQWEPSSTRVARRQSILSTAPELQTLAETARPLLEIAELA